jgi:hypothetical protein
MRYILILTFIYSNVLNCNHRAYTLYVECYLNRSTRERYILRDMLKLKSEKKLALLVAKLKKANEQTIEYAQSADEEVKEKVVNVEYSEGGGGAGDVQNADKLSSNLPER